MSKVAQQVQHKAWAGSSPPDSSDKASALQPHPTPLFESRQESDKIRTEGGFLSKEVMEGKPRVKQKSHQF